MVKPLHAPFDLGIVRQENEKVSKILLTTTESEVKVAAFPQEDCDWAKAAWAAIKMCEAHGQIDSLRKLLACG